MGVKVRGKKFHYRFQIGGQEYSGPCAGCDVPDGATVRELSVIRRRALCIEAAEKERAKKEQARRKAEEAEVRRNKTVRALVENYRYELTGGRPVAFAEAYVLAASKPSKRESRSSYADLRQSYWNDFAAFVGECYPDVKDVSGVTRSHCEAYVKYLADNGRFTNRSHVKSYAISGKTIKEIVGACRWVFSRIEEDAGLYRNPWDNVVLPAPTPIAREVFSQHELQLIYEGMQSDRFNYVLFFVAANSGLTEGDICTLRWADIDWANGFLRRDRRKTGTKIDCPLMPELEAFIQSQPRRGEYIFPEHAEMYLRQPSCVSERVKAFLHGLGIVTTVELPGHRAVSVKDLHSMRHVFCYRAKKHGIPEGIIKKIVGHKVLAMTQHYADHDTMDELRQEIKKLPALFSGGDCSIEDSGAMCRRRLAELAFSAPLETVQSILRAFEEPQCKIEYKATGD